MKIKYLLLVIVAFALIYSCNDDDEDEVFDHAAQSLLDDETIRTYLETHYYTPPSSDDEHFGSVDLIENGETPLIGQVSTQEVTYADIDFKIYYLKNMPEGVGMKPTKVDSALVNYKGLLLDTDKTEFDENHSFTFWANLYGSVIGGWSYALTNFSAGINNPQPDLPLNFTNTGKGVIFIPSGLAYSNSYNGSIPINSPLMFHIEMAMVKRNDQDFDGIKSIYEDLDNNDENNDDDSDGDGFYDYVDNDDDNDGILTKYENVDPNNDGNPDDAIDTDGDNTPDYLDNDDDDDGILTEDENIDNNNDGNPSDAKDTDGDNIPDYLDAN